MNDKMTKEVFEKGMSFLQQVTEDKAERQQRIAILDGLEEKRLELEIQKLQLEIKLLEKEVSDGTQETTPQ